MWEQERLEGGLVVGGGGGVILTGVESIIVSWLTA